MPPALILRLERCCSRESQPLVAFAVGPGVTGGGVGQVLKAIGAQVPAEPTSFLSALGYMFAFLVFLCSDLLLVA